MDRSNFAAELCQHRNRMVAVPGSACPNPIPHPFDTETDSDPDADLASPWAFSDDRKLGPKTYTYPAKRYPFTYTRMRRVRVRVRAFADQSDHCLNRGRGRGRNRNRNRSPSCMAHGLHGPLKLRCRVVSAPQPYGCGTRFRMSESHPVSFRYRDR